MQDIPLQNKTKTSNKQTKTPKELTTSGNEAVSLCSLMRLSAW